MSNRSNDHDASQQGPHVASRLTRRSRRERRPGSPVVAPVSPEPRTLQSALEGSESQVLVLRLTRAVRRPRGDRHPARRRPNGFRVAVLGLTVVALLCVAVGRGGRADADVALYALLLLALQAFSKTTWRELTDNVASHLDGIVTDLDERARAAKWMAARLRRRPQYGWSSVGGILACALAVLAARAAGSQLAWEAPFVLAVTATGFLGANVVYWLLAGAYWLWRFRTLDSLRLRTVPADEPAIEGCRTLLMHVMIRVSVGLLLCQMPLLALDSARPKSTFLKIETVTIGLLCTVTLIAITLGPALCLGHIKFVDQLNKVRELWREFYSLDLTDSERLERRCQVEQAATAILSRRRHKIDVAALLTVASTLGTVCVPYIVSVALEVPKLL